MTRGRREAQYLVSLAVPKNSEISFNDQFVIITPRNRSKDPDEIKPHLNSDGAHISLCYLQDRPQVPFLYVSPPSSPGDLPQSHRPRVHIPSCTHHISYRPRTHQRTHKGTSSPSHGVRTAPQGSSHRPCSTSSSSDRPAREGALWRRGWLPARRC